MLYDVKWCYITDLVEKCLVLPRLIGRNGQHTRHLPVHKRHKSHDASHKLIRVGLVWLDRLDRLDRLTTCYTRNLAIMAAEDVKWCYSSALLTGNAWKCYTRSTQLEPNMRNMSYYHSVAPGHTKYQAVQQLRLAEIPAFITPSTDRCFQKASSGRELRLPTLVHRLHCWNGSRRMRASKTRPERLINAGTTMIL